MAYGHKIKEIRQQSGLSQKDVADKMKINQTSVSDMEKAIYPPLNRIEQFCKVFDIKLWEFFVDNPQELNNYLPAGVYPEQIEFLKEFNLLPKEKQLGYLEAFIKIVELSEK